MFVSISIDTSLSKNNQNVQQENSNEYLIDPLGELVNIIRSLSAVGLPSFIAHKAKNSINVSLEITGNLALIDLGTLLYIITLLRAVTSISLSVQSYQKNVYLYDIKRRKLSYISGERFKVVWNRAWLCNTSHPTKSTKINQIVGLYLTALSITLPIILYNSLNSQIILI